MSFADATLGEPANASGDSVAADFLGQPITTTQTIGGLNFTLLRWRKQLKILGHLPDNDEDRFLLVNCSIEKNVSETDVTINNFCYTRNGRGSDYYKQARAVLRKHNRTVGGVLMEAIKTNFTAEAAKTGKKIVIEIGHDVWSTEGSTDDFGSRAVMEAAGTIINNGIQRERKEMAHFVTIKEFIKQLSAGNAHFTTMCDATCAALRKHAGSVDELYDLYDEDIAAFSALLREWGLVSIAITKIRQAFKLRSRLQRDKDWIDLPALIDTDDDVQTYVLYRYDRLYPHKEVSFKDYLEQTVAFGWYAPWIVGRTDVSAMGETATTFASL